MLGVDEGEGLCEYFFLPQFCDIRVDANFIFLSMW